MVRRRGQNTCGVGNGDDTAFLQMVCRRGRHGGGGAMNAMRAIALCNTRGNAASARVAGSITTTMSHCARPLVLLRLLGSWTPHLERNQQNQNNPNLNQLLKQDKDEQSERDVPAHKEGVRVTCAHADLL